MNALEIYNELHERTTHHLSGYRDDLEKHDKAWIEEVHEDGKKFIHLTRNNGTHLVSLDLDALPAHGEKVRYLFGWAGRVGCAQGAADTVEYFARPLTDSIQLVLYYDGEKFIEVYMKDALCIVREFVEEAKKPVPYKGE